MGLQNTGMIKWNIYIVNGNFRNSLHIFITSCTLKITHLIWLWAASSFKSQMTYSCVTEGDVSRMVPPHQVTDSQQQVGADCIQPRKLPNPVMASNQHRALHQELLFCHRRWESAELFTCTVYNQFTCMWIHIYTYSHSPGQHFICLPLQSENLLRCPLASCPVMWSGISSMFIRGDHV